MRCSKCRRINQIILSGVKPEHIASAAGISNFCRTISASFSTAVTVTIWQHRGDFHHAVQAAHLHRGRPHGCGSIPDLPVGVVPPPPDRPVPPQGHGGASARESRAA